MEKGGWIAVVVALITTAGVVASKYIEVGGKPATSTAVDGRGSGFVYTNIAQLNGSWHDQFGSRFLIAVTENRLTLSGSNGAKVMSGSGTADENTLKLAITNSFDSGTIHCVGPIGTATQIVATCTDPDGTAFDWKLSR